MVLAATSKAKYAYQQYAELNEIINDLSMSSEDKEKLLAALETLIKTTLPPRVTHRFRGSNLHGPCDTLFSFEPPILTKTVYYERAKLSEFENELDGKIVQDGLVTRLFENKFCESIIVDRTSQSLVVNYPTCEVVHGGAWKGRCIHIINETLKDYGYLYPIFHDGR